MKAYIPSEHPNSQPHKEERPGYKMSEMTTQLMDQLKNKISDSVMIPDADMKQYTSFQAGGEADLLIIPGSEESLKAILQLLAQMKSPFIVMGKGTNLLIRDGGYHGVVIRLEDGFSHISIDGTNLIAGAGASLASVARAAMENGLTGVEFASGIPGSLGGGVFMNAGAYDGELKDIVGQIRVLSGDGRTVRSVSNEEMKYGYRHSSLMTTHEIVLSASLNLKQGNRDEIMVKMKDYNDRRNMKQPMELPSAGSFFKRPHGYYAGKLIEDAGLKGLTIGGAQVSPKHSGFIVNTGGATASDIISLMKVVQATVLDQHGVIIEPEVRIIGEEA
jgi:UDP-N-acetylmuramate dehydrogenase